MDEAHVQHAVGLVKDQHLHGGQVQQALLLQVEQATGCGHQDVHAFFDACDLRVHAHAAKDDGGGELQVFAVGTDGLFHLRCQFPCGGEHQGTHTVDAKLVLGAAAHGELVQHRQGEGSGFAGAGLGTCQQVVACEHGWDGLGLDGSWGFVALFDYGFQDGRSQIQFFKVHDGAPMSERMTPTRLARRPPSQRSAIFTR